MKIFFSIFFLTLCSVSISQNTPTVISVQKSTIDLTGLWKITNAVGEPDIVEYNLFSEDGTFFEIELTEDGSETLSYGDETAQWKVESNELKLTVTVEGNTQETVSFIITDYSEDKVILKVKDFNPREIDYEFFQMERLKEDSKGFRG